MTALFVFFAVCLLSAVTLGMMALGSRARLMRENRGVRR